MTTRDAGWSSAFIAALVLGVASTLGDWIWARFFRDGSLAPAIGHGAAIFLLLALVLAWAARSRIAARRLLPSLPAAGVLLAASFYPLAGLIGYTTALLVSWVAMWLVTAFLQRWARESSESTARTLVRGVLAAFGSGAAFALVSGMWTDPSWSLHYATRFLLWSFAFLPGFLALLVAHSDV